jgi:hypothetical protein
MRRVCVAADDLNTIRRPAGPSQRSFGSRPKVIVGI